MALEVVRVGIVYTAAMIPFGHALNSSRRWSRAADAGIRDVTANISGVLTGLLVALVVRMAMRGRGL